MKIYTKTEIGRGYIPSDKVHYNNIPFESFGIYNFIEKEEYDKFAEEWERDKFNKISRDILIQKVKLAIMQSEKFKEIVKEGYHKFLYLNINSDGVDCFISR